ncbi:MAG: hypothetical protein Q9168_000568 [Polycauliona sp. 1 TL-2023]
MTKLEPLKSPAENLLESSQKRLQFRTLSPQTESAVLEDHVDSPQKTKRLIQHPAAAFASEISPSGKRRSQVNTLGTQFVLPSQVDPEVLAELPPDIRSKIQQREQKGANDNSDKPREHSRPASPSLVADNLPSHSQLDQETLDALPEDVRAEILKFYQGSPRKPNAQTLLPQSPHKNRSVKIASKSTTPTKKRTGLLFHGKGYGKSNAASLSTLTQSNFVANRTATAQVREGTEATADEDEVSPEFLAALPEDIRREVVDQQRRNRLKKRGGLDLAANHSKKRMARKEQQTTVGQRCLQLLARPAKPTFTARRLSELPDLREAMKSWVEEFQNEAPFTEDVDALKSYLTKVIQEEQNMSKAVAVIRWLKWLVEGIGESSKMTGWGDAIARIENGIQEAMIARGLGRVAI